MRIIATTPEENWLLPGLSEVCMERGVYPSVTNYGHGFGVTVWSVNDLDEVPAAADWPHEKKLRFMEMYGSKIGGATEDAWEKLKSYVDEFIESQ